MTPPENLTMKKYEVSVLRTAHCWATVHISAESEAEARASAIDKAEDFKEKSCEYSVEDVRLALKPYCVIHRDNGALLSEAPEVFLCQADDSDHAEEQTVNSYPNSDILWISENPDPEKALSEYYASNDHCLNPDQLDDKYIPDREQLKALFAAFLETQEGTSKDSWYVTDKEAAETVLKSFERFLYAEDDAKAERRRQYEALKKEFEPTN
jgi:hypothetical protein